MLTEESPADAESIADFKRATAEDNVSSILMKAVVDGWSDSRKDYDPLILGPGQTTRFFTRFFTRPKIEEKIEPFGHLVE